MLRELTPREGRKIYKYCAPLDFPRSELKPVHIVYRLLKRGDYHAYVYQVPTDTVPQGEIRAYAFMLECEHGALLDYFAVLSPHKGAGNGSAAIKELAQKVQGHMMLEVERVELAADEQDAAMRRRRIDFYAKNGGHLTDICTDIFTIPFRMMYFGEEMSTEEAAEKTRVLYNKMFGERIAKKYSRIFEHPAE